MRFERQQFAIVFAFIALIAVFAILQYRPLRNQAHAMQRVKVAQLAAAEKAEGQIKNLPSLRNELEQMRSKIGAFNKRIPDERMLGAFLKEIADVMNKHKLTEQMVQPNMEIQVNESFNCIPVKMQCKGTLLNMYEFLNSLQNLDRLMKIEQLQLKNDQELSGTISMIAVGNIYYRNAATGLGAQ